jgi:hypothetical protein
LLLITTARSSAANATRRFFFFDFKLYSAMVAWNVCGRPECEFMALGMSCGILTDSLEGPGTLSGAASALHWLADANLLPPSNLHFSHIVQPYGQNSTPVSLSGLR